MKNITFNFAVTMIFGIISIILWGLRIYGLNIDIRFPICTSIIQLFYLMLYLKLHKAFK